MFVARKIVEIPSVKFFLEHPIDKETNRQTDRRINKQKKQAGDDLCQAQVKVGVIVCIYI